MPTDLIATTATLSLVGGVLAMSAAAKRLLPIPTEWSRKAVHIGIGVTAAFTPALFSTPVLPIACGALLVLLFAVTRKLGVLSAVHGVRRATSGVIAFPIAGIVLMALTGGVGPSYVVPLLVVALADAAAALVGRPFGKHKFAIGTSVRSVEGSLAFFLVAFATTWIALSLSLPFDGTWVTVAVSLVVATLCTVAEAVSQRGWDNATVPLVAYAVLLVALAPTAANAILSIALFGVAALLIRLSGRTPPPARAPA